MSMAPEQQAMMRKRAAGMDADTPVAVQRPSKQSNHNKGSKMNRFKRPNGDIVSQSRSYAWFLLTHPFQSVGAWAITTLFLLPLGAQGVMTLAGVRPDVSNVDTSTLEGKGLVLSNTVVRAATPVVNGVKTAGVGIAQEGSAVLVDWASNEAGYEYQPVQGQAPVTSEGFDQGDVIEIDYTK